MKKLLILALCAMMLVSVFAIGTSAADEVTFSEDVGDIYVPSATLAGKTVTIDGVIDDDEPYTDPVRIDAHNASTAWTYRSRVLNTIDFYSSWDETGYYFGAEIVDPTPHPSTFSPDNDEDGEGSTSYGGNGDVIVFSIDPLAIRKTVGRYDWESSAPTAWYSIVPMDDGSFVVYRTQYNEGDITDEVDAEVIWNGDGTWSVEVKFTWEMLLEDAAASVDKTVEELGYTVADFAKQDAVHNAMIRYMDRWYYSSKDPYSGYHVGYLDEGARFTISCNITTSDGYLADGVTPATHGNGKDAQVYGIYLHMSEGKRYTSGDYTYISINNDTEAKIISYDGAKVDPLVIPKTIDGKTVTYISAKAFRSLAKINIYVPATVQTLEKNAFYSCLGAKLYVVEGSAAHTYAKSYFKNNHVLSCDVHTEGEWETVTPATCSAYGSKKMSCAVCGLQLKTGTISKLPHTEGEPVVTTVATCTGNGIKTVYCTVCTAKISSTSYTDPDNHDYPDTWYYNGVDFCQGGYKWRNCARCGEEQKSNEGITECVAGEWFTVIEPTETTSGFKVKQCVYCGTIMESEIIGRLVDKVIHSLTIEVTELDEGVKDMFIAKGAHMFYRQVANNKIYGEYAVKLESKDWYTSYKVAEPGVYTVYIRYNDGRAPFYYHVTIDLPVPEVTATTDGLNVTLEGLEDAKVIRMGKGDVEIANIKSAEGYRTTTPTGNPYTFTMKSEGLWTVVVEYNTGVKVKVLVEVTA